MLRTLSLSILLLCSACLASVIDRDFLLSENERRELDDYHREVDIGRIMAGKVLQYYGKYNNDKLLRYVNTVGLYLVKFSDHKERRYMFNVLDTQIVNTFACPGGYIFITLGAIMNMKNEAELAMVLSHEIAHIANADVFHTLQHLEKKDLNETPKEVDYILLARQRNATTYTNETGEDIVRYLSGKAGPGSGLIHASKVGLSLLLEKGLDPKMEFEADQVGVQIAVRAGYDPYAMQNFMSRLEEAGLNENTAMLETTHPHLKDRMSALSIQMQKIRAEDMIAAMGEKRFLRHTENL